MDNSTDSFKEKLENTYSFPALYMFKFIVKADKLGQLKQLFSKHEIAQKPSKEGKYISATIKIMASSSQEIIDIYKQASTIEGIISL